MIHILLNWIQSISKTNEKVNQCQYNIYFSAPNVSLDPESVHSIDNLKWKNDENQDHMYFLQQNATKNRWRIVRRRKCKKKQISDCVVL